MKSGLKNCLFSKAYEIDFCSFSVIFLEIPETLEKVLVWFMQKGETIKCPPSY